MENTKKIQLISSLILILFCVSAFIYLETFIFLFAAAFLIGIAIQIGLDYRQESKNKVKKTTSVLKPNNSYIIEKRKSIMKLFFALCDGPFESQFPSTHEMGLCKIDFDDRTNNLILYVRRPGIAIGKQGRTINALTKAISSKIDIIEIRPEEDYLKALKKMSDKN